MEFEELRVYSFHLKETPSWYHVMAFSFEQAAQLLKEYTGLPQMDDIEPYRADMRCWWRHRLAYPYAHLIDYYEYRRVLSNDI
jgi:hypothetical protein